MISEKRRLMILHVILIAVVVVASMVRVAPLLEGGERLQRQCVSEDGYLMLTIARNIALGRGFSVSDGLIPSNGTQPLSALIYALCYVCVGGDRIAGLYPVVAFQFLVSVSTAVLLYVFTLRYLCHGPNAKLVALVAASLWYASPTSLRHSQNSLETGLCALLILGSIALYDAFRPRFRGAFCAGRCLLLGLLLGIAFLGRNDVCFLVAAMLAVHVFLGYRRGQLQKALLQAFLVGAASVVVSLPWLWFNVTHFGHLVPVSGRAETLSVAFARNLVPAFPALLENLLLVLRIPASMQNDAYFGTFCGMSLVAVASVAAWKRRWLAERFSAGIGILASFSGALFVYYALFFGMPSFLGRYFFPVVTLAAVVGAAVVLAIVERLTRPVHKVLAVVVAMSAAAVCVGLDVRIYLKGRQHLHFQVVEWVAANVPDDVWVGAVQTGTLGYYHDRTVNLDGKVNPEALHARLRDEIPQYILDRNIEYLVDWVGLAKWANLPVLRPHFTLIVEDHERNLAVLALRDNKQCAKQ